MGVRRTITKAAAKAEGKFIKEELKRRGLKQTALLEDIPDVSIGLIGHWCNGISPIPDIDLLRLGRALDFNATDLRPSLRDYAEFFIADVRAWKDPVAAAIEADPSLSAEEKTSLIQSLKAFREVKRMKITVHTSSPIPSTKGKSEKKEK